VYSQTDYQRCSKCGQYMCVATGALARWTLTDTVAANYRIIAISNVTQLLNPTREQIISSLLPLWGGVDSNDLETHRVYSMGSDDVPHGSLTTRNFGTAETRVEVFELAYGPWGTTRELHWDGPRGECDPAALCARMADYLLEFSRINGRCYSTFRPKAFSNIPRVLFIFGNCSAEQMAAVA
jgi:hypothetical protein